MIPNLRVSVWVVICILVSIVDLVGFLYWWAVSVSGVSSIYILICIGLAVDYAAHVAHCFNTCSGSSRERAIQALQRIGPSTFNAIVSTFIAVVILAFSQSYVFRIFFKALFLVTVVGGMHGLWLLPVLLALCGGSKTMTDTTSSTKVQSTAETGSPAVA